MALLVTLLLVSSATGQEAIVQKECIALNNKDIDQTKAELLLAARRSAVDQLFGSLVTSLTEVENLSLKRDQIQSVSMGYVRFGGSPTFFNGENLGELCVRVQVYATGEDRAKLKPKELSKKTCLSEGDVSTIRKRAEERAVLEALVDYDGNLREMSLQKVLPLLHEVRFSEGGFVPETTTYCVRVSGILYPVEAASLALGDKSGTSESVKSPANSDKTELPSQPIRPKVSHITVSASAPWVKTGISLADGEEVLIEASGEASTTSGSSSGPDGQSYRCDSSCSFAGGWYGQLIAKVGADGQPTAIGKRSTLIADESGELFLAVNDCCDWSDNQGEFKVTITLKKK